MKIRIIDRGYESFTGHFGTVEFKDGVSIYDVSDAEARFFAAILSIENVADGQDPGANARFQAAINMAAVSVSLPTLADEQAAKQGVEGAAPVPSVAVTAGYTKDQLEAIADKGGIAGLREIADPMGIKGTSIAKLIEAILATQRGIEPEAAPLAEGQPDVVTSEQAQ